MYCRFEAFSRCDTEQRIGHIETFLRVNDDFESFKSLPLIVTSYNWSGNAVLIYSKRIKFFEKALPLLSGLKFINYKKLIEQGIDRLHKRIIYDQIENIMHG